MKSLQTRPPWPDELPRIKQFLKGTRTPGEALHPSLLVAAEPERVVGAAALGHRSGQHTANLYFKIRPRFCETAHFAPLLRSVEATARELDCRELIHVSGESGELAGLLKEQAFTQVKIEELWLLELRKIHARVAKLAARVAKSADYSVREPVEADLPTLRLMTRHYQFREADEVTFADSAEHSGQRYERSLSSVVESQGHVAAAMLVKGSQTLRGHVDLRMVDPDYRRYSGRLNLLLLAQSIGAGLAQGYEQTTITVNRSRDIETTNMLRRSGGRRYASKIVWRKELIPPAETHP